MEENKKNDSNKQPEESSLKVNKSSATINSKIDFSKEIIVNRIFADSNLIAQHKEKLSKSIPNINQQMLDYEMVQVVIKDNLFSAAMNEIVTHFNFNLDADYVNTIKAELKNSLASQNVDDNAIAAIADKIIKKQLVFNELAKLWDIKVTDDEVKAMLDVFYKRTNQSIHEVLSDPLKFEGIRNAILEEKLILKTIASFPIRFELVNPNFINNDSGVDKNKEESKS